MSRFEIALGKEPEIPPKLPEEEFKEHRKAVREARKLEDKALKCLDLAQAIGILDDTDIEIVASCFMFIPESNIDQIISIRSRQRRGPVGFMGVQGFTGLQGGLGLSGATGIGI